MKKTFWTLVILVVILAGIYIWQRKAAASQNYINNTAAQASTTALADTNGTSGFISADGSISFSYPNTLTVSQTNNIITINHQINFANTDACNMKGAQGNNNVQSPTLTDFHVTMQTYNMTIASSAAIFDPTLASTSENIDGTLTLNSGLIDPYNVGPFNGYMVTESVEGCGYVTYYLPVNNMKTLVVQKELIGALSDIADPINKAKILSTTGAISTDQSDQIFSGIISSLSVR